MSIFSRLLAWLDWAPVPLPRARRRRIRATCEVCGKSIAVIESTGKLWTHLNALGILCEGTRVPTQPEGGQ